jgi:hypothetical protein
MRPNGANNSQLVSQLLEVNRSRGNTANPSIMDAGEPKMIVEILATLACGIFAGAAVYVNLVEQPARLSCGVSAAITEWRPSYKRGTAMQAPLATIGSILGFISWWLEKDTAWLIGGTVFLAVVPFTLIVILPTNKMLENDKLDSSSAHAEQLLRRWGRLHAVRSGVSFLAFVTFLFALRHRS